MLHLLHVNECKMHIIPPTVITWIITSTLPTSVITESQSIVMSYLHSNMYIYIYRNTGNDIGKHLWAHARNGQPVVCVWVRIFSPVLCVFCFCVAASSRRWNFVQIGRATAATFEHTPHTRRWAPKRSPMRRTPGTESGKSTGAERYGWRACYQRSIIEFELLSSISVWYAHSWSREKPTFFFFIFQYNMCSDSHVARPDATLVDVLVLTIVFCTLAYAKNSPEGNNSLVPRENPQVYNRSITIQFSDTNYIHFQDRECPQMFKSISISNCVKIIIPLFVMCYLKQQQTFEA